VNYVNPDFLHYFFGTSSNWILLTSICKRLSNERDQKLNRCWTKKCSMLNIVWKIGKPPSWIIIITVAGFIPWWLSVFWTLGFTSWSPWYNSYLSATSCHNSVGFVGNTLASLRRPTWWRRSDGILFLVRWITVAQLIAFCIAGCRSCSSRLTFTGWWWNVFLILRWRRIGFRFASRTRWRARIRSTLGSK
jgi:hypothetical protein